MLTAGHSGTTATQNFVIQVLARYMPHHAGSSLISTLRRAARRLTGRGRAAGLIDPALAEASDNKIKLSLNALENWVAPREYLAALTALRKQSPTLYERVLKQPAAHEIATGSRVQRFVRRKLAQGGTLYQGPGRFNEKSLLVVCAGYARRPGMPVPAFLQRIDDRQFDILVLNDPHRNHYRKGVSEQLDSLNSVAEYIQEFRTKKRYRKLITLGTSGGGFPAVRLALMAGADKAISFGGSFPDDTLRILRNQVHAVPAFDPICACLGADHPEFTFVYSNESPRYRNACLTAAELTGGAVVEVQPVMEHAVLGPLWARGYLDAFLPGLLAEDFPASMADQPNWSARPQGGYVYKCDGPEGDGK